MTNQEFLKEYLGEKLFTKVQDHKFPENISNYNENDWEISHIQSDIERLDTLSKLPKKTVIYTTLRYCSPNGMNRIIDAFYVQNNRPIRIHFTTSKIFWKRHNKSDDKAGYKMKGCGMDMGFHLVNSLSYLVSRYKNNQSDGYYFDHEWV